MIVVTGGAGFIGSAFVWKLNSEGIDDILIVDNLGATDKWKNLVHKKYCDYLDKNAFLQMIQKEKLQNVEAIVHMGACSSTTNTDANYLMENNYHYTLTLARWAIKNQARFICASSGATYGDGSCGYSDENANSLKLAPLNMYGYSKQLFDLWALRNKAADKIVALKFFNVFGPNEYHKEDMASVVFKAFHQIMKTGNLGLFKSYKKEYADGEQLRDFVYIKDCVEVIWWFLKNKKVNGIFNVGTGKARTWNDLAMAVFSAMDKDPKIEYIPMPEAIRDRYQYFTQAEVSKIKSVECPCTSYSLELGVTDYVRNYLQKGYPDQYL